MPKILLIEDDDKIVAAVQKAFSLEKNFTVSAVSDAAKAVSEAVAKKPDIILLDIRLPGGDGRQILRQLKENVATSSRPVIFLTGLASEGDRVLGLNMGADDYVVKPFGALELIARVQAVLRRTQPATADKERIRLAGLDIDRKNYAVSYGGHALDLQPKEFEILYLLASHPGRTLSRNFLMENSSSYGIEVSIRSLDTHIKNLRRKLGSGARLIETVPKMGYRFVATDV